jgi:CheY-like chemotaxis protein
MKVYKTKKRDYRYQSVLLIDDSELDNFINRKIMESCLFARDIQIETLAEKVLESFHPRDGIIPSELPEVIFIDLNMPVMDGFTFIEGLLKIKKIQEVQPRLVVLTSSVSPRDRDQVSKMDPGILFLNKPLTPQMLAAV